MHNIFIFLDSHGFSESHLAWHRYLFHQHSGQNGTMGLERWGGLGLILWCFQLGPGWDHVGSLLKQKVFGTNSPTIFIIFHGF